jgi:dihydroxyacid dehydratase/phosphogluconate dehydratase
MLRERPSGDLFGWTQNAGMGWEPSALGGREFLMLSTHGGIRAPDGTPIALGYHTGHWEVGLLMEAAAREFKAAGAVPFAASCTDPCDGRSQGTPAMFDSLAYRNDAAIIFRRLIRSLPTRRGVLGVATCDKGLPAMMMALAASHDLSTVLVPGGVTLLPIEGDDAARVQTIGVRFAHHELTLQEASDLGCRACASPGGGCQFLGTAATSQVVGEALGMSLGHSALAPSGHPIWLDMARRSARADGARSARHADARHPHRRRAPECHGHPRRFWRLHQPHSPPAGDRPRCRPAPADRRRLDGRLQAGPSPCRRAPERTQTPSDDPGVSRRRGA